jgi:hypothetical protein
MKFLLKPRLPKKLGQLELQARTTLQAIKHYEMKFLLKLRLVDKLSRLELQAKTTLQAIKPILKLGFSH